MHARSAADFRALWASLSTSGALQWPWTDDQTIREWIAFGPARQICGTIQYTTRARREAARGQRMHIISILTQRAFFVSLLASCEFKEP